jgi:DNA ligase D-like protein (predicted 3'-phosphoesterase)
MKFVIQEYRLSNGGLRYYLRLEKDGVLKGWAVPKGLPEKGEKQRLALEVGPFKLSAAGFEGEVAKSKFGPGMMSIWDQGEYRLDSWLENRIIFELFGSRVKGSFALVRFTKAGSLHWLLSRPHGSPSAPKSETAVKKPEKSPSVPPSRRAPARRPTVETKKDPEKNPPTSTPKKSISSQSKSETTEDRIQKPVAEPEHAKSQGRKVLKKKRQKERESYYRRSRKRAKRMNKRRYTKKIHMLGVVFIVFVLIIYGLVKLIQYISSLY